MKVGITCGGIGPYASGDFLRRSVQAAEQVGFAHYWIPDHVILFAAYPQSKYPYAEGSGQQVPDQDPDAPLQFGDDTFALVDPTVAFADPVNDLALLQADRAAGEPTGFRESLRLDPGEDVVTVGYPLSGLLGSNAQVTTGTISALTGTANDSRVLQFTAPVQTGNSGGPLFDAYGLVVGIVSHKLNAEHIHRITGDIPQNVNFAVKGAVARAFLLAAGMEPPTAAPAGARQSAAEIASAARDRVVQVLVET